jgi:hypothetical protein
VPLAAQDRPRLLRALVRHGYLKSVVLTKSA